MSNKETATGIFNEGVEAGDSRDMIIVKMVQAGVTLNTAQNLYKELADAAGLTVSRVGYKAEALEFIADEVQTEELDLTDSATRLSLRATLQEKYGVAQSTANDYIKAYAEENNIELPRSNFGADPEAQEKIFQWIVKNPDCDKPEFVKFMKDEMGRSPGSIDETYRGLQLARKLQEVGVQFA